MRPVTVLLVDDEQDFTEILSERLRNRELIVDISSNGAEALTMADEKSYDAVVLDLAMPEMDGIETLKRLLRHNPDLQVIFLTGRGSLQQSVEAMKSGAFEFMEKPPKIEELVGKIMEAKTTKRGLSEQRMLDNLDQILKQRGW